MEVGDCINLPIPSIISPVMQLFDAYLGAAWELSCAYAEYFKRTAQGPYVSASKKAVAAPPNK